jgi:hypothetical protein
MAQVVLLPHPHELQLHTYETDIPSTNGSLWFTPPALALAYLAGSHIWQGEETKFGGWCVVSHPLAIVYK